MLSLKIATIRTWWPESQLKIALGAVQPWLKVAATAAALAMVWGSQLSYVLL